MYYPLALALFAFCAKQAAGKNVGNCKKDDPCDDVDCNGGTCTSEENGQTSCLCPELRSGEFCEIISCPQLAGLPNGEVSYASTAVGSSAIYICDTDTDSLCIHEKLTCGNDGKWDKEPPVCVEEIAKDDSYRVSYRDSTYYFSNFGRPVIENQAFCEQEGGNLLSINSDEEWEFIKCVLQQDTSGEVRSMGLINNGTWEWTSGQPVTVTYWSTSTNPSSGSCAVIGTGAWIAYNTTMCNGFRRKFICETSNA